MASSESPFYFDEIHQFEEGSIPSSGVTTGTASRTSLHQIEDAPYSIPGSISDSTRYLVFDEKQSSTSTPSTPTTAEPAKERRRISLSEEGDDNVRLNGGFTAWSQVFVSFLLFINGFGYFSSFGLFQSHWVDVLGSSVDDVAWVGSISLFLLFFLGSLSGPLMDRGYFRSIVAVGCAFQILGAFTTSAVTRYWQLILAQGVVQGIGNGLVFTPSITLVSVYFTKNRAFAFSLAACGAPVGGIIFPLIARQLTPTIGYPWTIRVFGFIMVFNSALILLLGRPRRFKSEPRPMFDPAAFRESVYATYSIGIFFTLWGLYIAYFYTATFGRSVIGFSSEDSLTLLIVLNAVGTLGRIIPAYIADRYLGPFNTLVPAVLCCAIMMLSWMGVHSSGGFYAFISLYGFFSNSAQALVPMTSASMATHPSNVGQRVGMVFSVGSLACLTGPPLAGVLLGVGHGSYQWMQLYGGVSILIGFTLLTLSRSLQARKAST
ncbi:hypothetical protein VTH82DRAFT_2207 [Thermothelomyces myriococcoides]